MSKGQRKKYDGPIQHGSGMQNVLGSGTINAVTGHGQLNISNGETVPKELRNHLDSLLHEIEELRLTSAERKQAQGEVASIAEALDTRKPNAEKAATHLQKLTAGLKEAGELATAGSTVATAISNIAGWLGPIGVGVMSML